MDTDLDPDDTIGRRFGALRTWEPPLSEVDAWPAVERRRGRRRARHYALAAAAIVIVVVGSVTAVTSLRSSGKSDRQIVVTPSPQDPSIVSVLPPAPVGGIDVQPAGPYRAGQRVRAYGNPPAESRAQDPYNDIAEVCFSYGGGEICDSTVRSSWVDLDIARGVAAYELSLPGWVHTPAGLQPCRVVACRIEIVTNNGRIGTPPLTIDSGPKPAELARLNGIHRDESLVSLHVDALRPDPSWTALDLAQRSELPPGGMSICAFAERLRCDALVQPDPPPFDGVPHDLTIATNRLLLTSGGWVDCVHDACAIVITRTIDAVEADGGVGSNAEIIAIVPYRLPATTPVMARPSLKMVRRLDRGGPLQVNDQVFVTLHDPPPNTDLDGLRLWHCAAERLDLTVDCGYRFDPWTRSADGSLRMTWRASRCPSPRGCYLAVAPPSKGYPEVARTPGRFTVSP